MTERSPVSALATALKRLNDADVALACVVTRRTVTSATKRRPITADHYFRLCAFAGVDPVSGWDIAPRAPGPFDQGLFSLGVALRRMLNGHSLRQAGKAMGISYASVERIEDHKAVSIETTLAACKYVGVHPFGYCHGTFDVSRGTGGVIAPQEGARPDVRAA